MEISFGEKELFRQGGAIREYESIGRLQGESISAFVRRFRLLERRLADHRVPQYPEASRVVKLLDGLRLDEKSTASLLLAAGNRYDMSAVLDAIRIQYPPGMTITGIPHQRATRKTPPSARPRHKRSWNTGASWDYTDDDGEDVEDEQAVSYDDHQDYVEAPAVPSNDQSESYNDVVYDEEQDSHVQQTSQQEDGELWSIPEFAQAVEALTVTSKRLADLTRARGFYQASDKKGKGTGKGKSKSKAKSDSRSFSKGSSSKGAKSKGKGVGKPSPTPTRSNFDQQRSRLSEARCLGCNEVGHFIRECPYQSTYSAQVTTAGVSLDAEGNVQQQNNSSWVVAFSDSSLAQKEVALPSLVCEGDCVARPPHPEDLWEYIRDTSSTIIKNPSVLIQYADVDATLMIADTGCQRQVAGVGWHRKRQLEILPLEAHRHVEQCTFSFGPNAGVPSSCRWSYPAGLGGKAVQLGVSQVEIGAPALFSRPAFEALGAVPDIHQGIMFYRALDRQSTLFLTKCGHLAIRVDEWPDEPFEWPLHVFECPPDVFVPGIQPLKGVKLTSSDHPALPPPHAGSALVASAMEAIDGDVVRPPERDSDGGALLRGSKHEAIHQGQAPPHVLPKSDSHHHVAVHHGLADAVNVPEAAVPTSTKPVSSRPWATSVWSSRLPSEHLRSVRSSLGCGVRRHPQEHHAQSISDSDHSFGPATKEQGSISGQGSIGRVLGWLTTTIGALAVAASAISDSSTTRSATFDGAQDQGILTDGTTFPLLGELPDLAQPSEDATVKQFQRDELGTGCQLCGPSVRMVSTGTTSARPNTPGRWLRGREPRGLRLGGSKGAFIGDSQTTHGGAARAARGGGSMSPSSATLHGSADDPLMREDRGHVILKKGTQKRLLGNIKSVRQWLTMEANIYQTNVKRAHRLRRRKCDLVEIYGGFANISAEGLSRGLRVTQPVDQVHGVQLDSVRDHVELRRFLLQLLPFLSIWELRCDAWSRIQHLNYSEAELKQLQDEQKLAVREMVKTVLALHAEGCHFLLENPWGTAFWQQPELQPLLVLPGVELKKGAMCNFGLRGGSGRLLRKDTGWCSDLSRVLDRIAIPCSQDHEHEECLGANAKRGQIYTKKLARAVIDGLLVELCDRGDERFLHHGDECVSWTTGTLCTGPESVFESSMWLSTLEASVSVWYVDIVRDAGQWEPLLQEVKKRLQDKVANAATLKLDTAFAEQVRALVPWNLHSIQLVKTPKVRRLPLNLMMEKFITHRGAVLLHNTGQITFETEVVADISHAPGGRFSTPVAYGIFFFGEAGQTSMNPEDDRQPESTPPAPGTPRPKTPRPRTPRPQAAPSTPAPTTNQSPGTPGVEAVQGEDISFPDVPQNAVPQWMRSVLRRLHVNLGHPSQEALVRHLSQAGATGAALYGAKHLRCGVCARTKAPPPPRPAKAFQARRFNDRLMMDVFYIKDMSRNTHTCF